jgi:hypothetical protein
MQRDSAEKPDECRKLAEKSASQLDKLRLAGDWIKLAENAEH